MKKLSKAQSVLFIGTVSLATWILIFYLINKIV